MPFGMRPPRASPSFAPRTLRSGASISARFLRASRPCRPHRLRKLGSIRPHSFLRGKLSRRSAKTSDVMPQAPCKARGGRGGTFAGTWSLESGEAAGSKSFNHARTPFPIGSYFKRNQHWGIVPSARTLVQAGKDRRLQLPGNAVPGAWSLEPKATLFRSGLAGFGRIRESSFALGTFHRPTGSLHHEGTRKARRAADRTRRGGADGELASDPVRRDTAEGNPIALSHCERGAAPGRSRSRPAAELLGRAEAGAAETYPTQFRKQNRSRKCGTVHYLKQ